MVVQYLGEQGKDYTNLQLLTFKLLLQTLDPSDHLRSLALVRRMRSSGQRYLLGPCVSSATHPGLLGLLGSFLPLLRALARLLPGAAAWQFMILALNLRKRATVSEFV